MGLTALLLLQHARAPRAARCRRRDRAARGPGSQPVGPQDDRRGAGADRQGAAPPPPRPLPGAGGDRALHARAARPEDTDWAEIDLLYATLERLQPSPVVTLNRAVAVSKVRGPAGGARHDRAAGGAALGLFPLLRREGRAADAARPRRRGARRLRPRDRARQHRRRGRAHPHAPRPPDEGQPRRRAGKPPRSDWRSQVASTVPEHFVVIAGLDPAIHSVTCDFRAQRNGCHGQAMA